MASLGTSPQSLHNPVDVGIYLVQLYHILQPYTAINRWDRVTHSPFIWLPTHILSIAGFLLYVSLRSNATKSRSYSSSIALSILALNTGLHLFGWKTCWQTIPSVLVSLLCSSLIHIGSVLVKALMPAEVNKNSTIRLRDWMTPLLIFATLRSSNKTCHNNVGEFIVMHGLSIIQLLGASYGFLTGKRPASYALAWSVWAMLTRQQLLSVRLNKKLSVLAFSYAALQILRIARGVVQSLQTTVGITESSSSSNNATQPSSSPSTNPASANPSGPASTSARIEQQINSYLQAVFDLIKDLPNLSLNEELSVQLSNILSFLVLSLNVIRSPYLHTRREWNLGRISPAGCGLLIWPSILIPLSATLFYQFRQNGKNLVVKKMSWGLPALMISMSVFLAFQRQPNFDMGFISSIAVLASSTYIYRALKSSGSSKTLAEEIMIYLPTSLFQGWSSFLFLVSFCQEFEIGTYGRRNGTYAYFDLYSKFLVIFGFIALEIAIAVYTFSTPHGGDLPATLAITLGFMSLASQQQSGFVRKVARIAVWLTLPWIVKNALGYYNRVTSYSKEEKIEDDPWADMTATEVKGKEKEAAVEASTSTSVPTSQTISN